MKEGKAVSLLVVLLISLIPITSDKSMPDLHHSSQTGSRNSDMDCAGYNLQDYYQYDYADFHYTINADWATSNLHSSLFFNARPPMGVLQDPSNSRKNALSALTLFFDTTSLRGAKNSSNFSLCKCSIPTAP